MTQPQTIAPHLREIGRRRDSARALGIESAHAVLAILPGGTVTDLENGTFALGVRMNGESLAALPRLPRGIDALVTARWPCDALHGQGPVPERVEMRCRCIARAVSERGSTMPADTAAE